MLVASLHDPGSYCMFFCCLQDDIDEATSQGTWPHVLFLSNHTQFRTALVVNGTHMHFSHRIYWDSIKPVQGGKNLYELLNVKVDDLLDFVSLPWSAEALAGQRFTGFDDGVGVIHAAEPFTIPETWIDVNPFPVERVLSAMTSQRNRLRMIPDYFTQISTYFYKCRRASIYKGVDFDSFCSLFRKKGYYTYQDLNDARPDPN